MSVGLYSREVVAVFLGKKVEEVERMIDEDDLPAVPLMSEKRTRHKFSATQLTAWLNKRAKGQRWTVDQVIAELDRCVPDPAITAASAKLVKVGELQALCEAASRTLRNGLDCPRLLRAMADVVEELKPKEAA